MDFKFGKVIKNIAQGFYYKHRQDTTKDLPDYFLQQVYWRMNQCPTCAVSPKCPHCKCFVPQLFFAPEKECKRKKWPPMMEKHIWEKYLIDNNITYIEGYGDIISNSTKGSGDQGNSGITE